MDHSKVDELVVRLDESLEISSMKQGVKLVVMNHNFDVKRWPSTLSLEEIKFKVVPFLVQIRGLQLNLCTEASARKLSIVMGEFLEMEDLECVKGFLRVKIAVDTEKSLVMGCWLARSEGRDSWVEFWYKRLQDFCYKCGRIGHALSECSSLPPLRGYVIYGEWTWAKQPIDKKENRRVSLMVPRNRQQAGLVRERALGHGLASSNSAGEIACAERDIRWMNLTHTSWTKRRGGRRPEKKLKYGSSSNASGGGNRSCFVGMPILEKWSMVEKAIMSEDELQDVPVIEDDNIWDYLDGAAKVEIEALNVRRAGKQPWGGGGWPKSAAKLP
ncbi:hypothetical protein ACFX2H_027739 [Malus domestica]